jgi:hypothetical protein
LEKIEEDAKYDGYYGIQSSEKELSAMEIIDAYATLWKIEESFRIMKSTLEVEPVFHWSPSRIHGHFVLCFLAFLMERSMELLMKHDESDDCISSPARIQEALMSMQLAAVSTTADGEMFIKAKPLPLAKKIFKNVGLSLPANFNTRNDLHALYGEAERPDFVQMSIL